MGCVEFGLAGICVTCPVLLYHTSENVVLPGSWISGVGPSPNVILSNTSGMVFLMGFLFGDFVVLSSVPGMRGFDTGGVLFGCLVSAACVAPLGTNVTLGKYVIRFRSGVYVLALIGGERNTHGQNFVKSVVSLFARR